jgi:adenylate kinase family enzyme
VPAELLVERVVGRRMDPETGAIYHLKYKPPPADVMDRLVQRSDDTEEKVRRKKMMISCAWGLPEYDMFLQRVCSYGKPCCNLQTYNQMLPLGKIMHSPA